MVIEYIMAVLFGLVGIFYFVSGMVFSRAWGWLGKIFGSTDTMLSKEALASLNALGDLSLPSANPVLSAFVKSNTSRGVWMLIIGLALALTTVMLLLSWVGLWLVLGFALLEVCLGIFFYWKHDGYKKGLQYIVIYSIMATVAIIAMIF